MNTQTKHSLMLMLCAFIWGTAFVAQSAGSGMGGLFFFGRAQLAGGAGAAAHRPCLRCPPPQARRSLWLAQSPCRPQASADGGALLRHPAVCGLRCPADRHHAQPFHGQGWFPDRHVCGAGAGIRAVSGAAGQCPALAEHGHRRGRALPALHEKRLWRH